MGDEIENQSFGSYLKNLRVSRKLTLKSGAALLKMSPQRLCDIESGRRSRKHVSSALIDKIRIGYDVTADEVLSNLRNTMVEFRTSADVFKEISELIEKTHILAAVILNWKGTYGSFVDLAKELNENMQKLQELKREFITLMKYETAKES